MMRSVRYSINAPSVVSEVIDGEAVIVNMENGSYYSIDDSGAFVWDLLCQGARLEDVVETVQRSYSGSDIDVESIVSELINEFLKEELLVELEDQGESAAPQLKPESFECSFTAPELKKYTDMEELLLLDPIHEESDSGEETRQAV